MTITLFQDRNFRGRRQNFTYDVPAPRNRRDTANLVGSTVGKNPSSVRMDPEDAVLLCGQKDFRGKVLYLRGGRDVSDLGEPNSGGLKNFRNSVKSVRIRPFLIDLNIIVATGSDGTLPARYRSRDSLERDVDICVRRMNRFFRRERSLIRIRRGDLTFEPSEQFYNISIPEYRMIPRRWRRNDMADVLLVNRLTNASGVGWYPWAGKHMAVALDRSDSMEDGELVPGFDRLSKISRTWAHELGHYWGLEHENAFTQEDIDELNNLFPGKFNGLEPSNSNIMIQSGSGSAFNRSTLSTRQLNQIHTHLSQTASRRKERQERIPGSLI